MASEKTVITISAGEAELTPWGQVFVFCSRLTKNNTHIIFSDSYRLLTIARRMPMRARNKAVPYLPSYMEEGQPCVVCGDEATGLHYRAITCEGCKGFFRRTAQFQRRLQYTCKTDGQCDITKGSRNVCQQCRLIKCLKHGMSCDLVLNETERQAKRTLIKENREKKQLDRIVQQLKTNSLHDRLDHQSLLNTVTEAFCRCIDIVSPHLAPEREQEQVSGINNFQVSSPSLILQSLFTTVIRRCLDFAKAMPVFHTLSKEQQKALIDNQCWLEVHLLHVITRYDSLEQCIVLPNGERCSSTENEMGDRFEALLGPLLPLAEAFSRMQLDNQMIALISAVFIFNPDTVKSTQDDLWNALRALVEESQSDSPDSGRWFRLVCRIADFRSVVARLKEHFLDGNNAHLIVHIFA